MTDPNTSEIVCASCGTKSTGRFCSNCGGSLEPGACAHCGATTAPDARFCHNCGAAVGGSAPKAMNSGSRSSLPWIVSAIALIGVLAFLAGRSFSRNAGNSADSQSALPQAALGSSGPGGNASGIIRAPDISQLSPQEQADRLFNRVMNLDRAGKTDSVLFFAPMALEAYQMLAPLNADQRYDMGRVAEVAGAYPLARAQADTILAENPNSLLGLVLAVRVAGQEKRATDLKQFQSRLVKAYPSEWAKKLPEYARHEDDIRSALSNAQKSGGE